MSRKDYELIADVISGYRSNAAVQALAVAMCKRLADTNPRFDKQRFLKACGVTEYDASWM